MNTLIRQAARIVAFAALFVFAYQPAQADEAPPLNRAQVVAVQAPNLMTAGATHEVKITLRNVGTTTWSRKNDVYGHKLGSQCPQDNQTWGTNRIFMPPGKKVYPGQYFTFVFDVTAPTTPGYYCFQWKMVEEGVEWFDFATPARQIHVIRPINAAKFIGQQVPSHMQAGKTAQVSLTFKNVGTTTWARKNNVYGHKLGSECPRDNQTWGTNRVKLPPGVQVKPGHTYTFVFTITAPQVYGPKCFQWRMLEEGVAWFGQLSGKRHITVTNYSTAQSN